MGVLSGLVWAAGADFRRPSRDLEHQSVCHCSAALSDSGTAGQHRLRHFGNGRGLAHTAILSRRRRATACWWQIDLSRHVIRFLLLGLAWNVKVPSRQAQRALRS